MILNFWPFNIKRKKEQRRKKRIIIILCVSGVGVVLLGATTGITVALTQNKDTVLKNKNQATKYLKKHAVQTNPSSFEFNDYDGDNQQDYDFICSNLTLQLFVNSVVARLITYVPPFSGAFSEVVISNVSGIHIKLKKTSFIIHISLSMDSSSVDTHHIEFHYEGSIQNNKLSFLNSTTDNGGGGVFGVTIDRYDLIGAFVTNSHYITCSTGNSSEFGHLRLSFKDDDRSVGSITLSPNDWEDVQPKQEVIPIFSE